MKTVYFNMQERKLCSKCKFPEGFCVHTIEDKYKEFANKKPSLDQESVWQLHRDYALRNKSFDNVCRQLYKCNKEISELRDEISSLREFKKNVNELIIDAIKEKKQ